MRSPKFAQIALRVIGLATVVLLTSNAHAENTNTGGQHTVLEEVTIVASCLIVDVISVESIDLNDVAPLFALKNAKSLVVQVDEDGKIHGVVDNVLNTENEHMNGFRTPRRTFSIGAREAL